MNALGSACLAWLALTGVVYLIIYISRRRAEHGWLAVQSLLAAAYPLSQLDLLTSDSTAAVAVGLACAASVVFTRAHFGLPAPGWTWLVLAALGSAAGVLANVGLAGRALGAVMMLLVAAAVAHQIEELWRLSRRGTARFNARVLLVAWVSLGVGVAIECILGYPTAIVGLTLLAFLYTVALARQHGLSLEEAERHRQELEHRLATIENKNHEIEALNEELRRQIGLRSRQLAKVLAAAPKSVLDVGAVIAGRYRIAKHLGTGGMGIVYEVTRITDGRAFALKLLLGHARGEVLARFAREAEILAQLHHPNLVSIVDIDVFDGQLFLVMELVEGMSLAASLSACESRAPAWCLRVLTDIAAGLVKIHGAGIVHRDLKPANVLVSDGGAAKIADFGVSSFDPLAVGELATLEHLTVTGAILGTPGYMAPELLRGVRAATFAVDVFAFGVLAYHLLGGRAMQRGDLHAQPSLGEIAPALPPELVDLVDACLEREPAARPTSADVLACLRALPALPNPSPRPPTNPTLARGSTEIITVRSWALATPAAPHDVSVSRDDSAS